MTRKIRARQPQLSLELQRWRMRFTLLLLFSGFIALSARAVYLQTWQTSFLNEEGDKRVQRVLPIPAYRGVISDRRGEPLAVSTPVESFWLNPREAKASGEQIAALAKLLDRNPAQLAKVFADQSKGFVYLERLVEPPRAGQIAALKIEGLYSKPEYRRYYPSGEVMAHVLGFTNIEDQGQEGIELTQQKWLVGEPGAERVVRDRHGNVIEILDQVRPPKPGHDLTLALNQHIQYLAYKELNDAVSQNQARAGAAVVLDARSGEILALVNTPSFNPNSRATFEVANLRNRAVTDSFEPGSTMKPMLVSAALEAGVVTPDTLIDTGNGSLQVGEKTIRDVHAKGLLSVAQAIQVSSNVAVARIALEKLRGEDFWGLLSRAGFGKAPASGLPGEVAGKIRPYDTWRPIEKATMAFGHGMSVSLLQLAHAYTAFANEGVMPTLTAVKRDANTPAQGSRVMKPETARQVLAMLELVTRDDGTAPQARVTGYRVGGKTGTAHKVVNGSYAANKYVASFVGLAPVSNPRLVVAVMIDEPMGKLYYGGLVAAPVFSKVMAGALRFMAVSPDAPFDKTSAPPNGAPVIPEVT